MLRFGGNPVSPAPRFDPTRKKIAKANIRLEAWMWDEIRSISDESEGALSQNDVITELMRWALEEYRKTNPRKK